MRKVARFEKVSLERFINDFKKFFLKTDLTEDEIVSSITKLYDDIKLPSRATKGSAGYDFFAPIGIELKPHETIKIPTGIRVFINDGWVLKCYPRSGLGFKYRVQLDNTVAIIDSDYYYSDNEGHIFIKISNDGYKDKTVTIQKGVAFAQGIFVEYGVTFDDDVDTKQVRNGGFGSTNNR